VSERDQRPDAHSDLTSSKLRRCREHRPIAHHRPPSATLGSFRSRRVFCLATPDDKHHWSAGTAGQMMMMEPWPLFCIAAASVQYISARVYLKKSVSQRPCDTDRYPSAQNGHFLAQNSPAAVLHHLGVQAVHIPVMRGSLRAISIRTAAWQISVRQLSQHLSH